MKNILTIAWREFTAWFISPIAYVTLTVFLVAASGLFFRGFFAMGQADLRLFFDMMPWFFLFFAPAIAMGTWSEERMSGTIETLLTLPVHDSAVVIGKFLAAVGLIATALTLTLPVALTVAVVGDLDWGPVIGSYLGTLFLGSAFLAAGLAISAATESQIIAFIGGIACGFVLLLIGTPIITGGSVNWFAQLLQYLGLGTHFTSIARGVIDSRDVIYYLSVIGIALYVNLIVVKAKR
jgi:ABC-2 type transport system permease protein